MAARPRLLEDLVIDPEKWQSSLLTLVLRLSVLLGLILYPPSLYAALQFRYFPLAAIDTIAFAGIIGLYRFDGMPFHWRGAIFCLIFYMIAVGTLAFVGPVSQIFLFVFSILAVLLLGIQAGFLSAVLSSATLFAVGWLGYAAPSMGVSFRNKEFVAWAAITLNFSVMNILLTLSIGAVFRALNNALQREVAGRVSLERERTLLRTLVDALPDAVFTKDRNGVYLAGNPAALALVGLEHEHQLTGKTAFDFIPPELAELRHAEDMGVISGRALRNREEQNVDLAGNSTYHLTTKVPLCDADGAVVGLIIIHRDITDLKLAEAERGRLLSQLQLQIERMPLGYLLSDGDFRYTRWNPAAELMFGFTEAEVVGKHPFDVIVPPQSRPWLSSIFDACRAGSMDAHGESENQTSDGRIITCEWHNTPLFETDGAFVGLLSLAQDITERKKLATQLRQSQKMEAIGQLAGGVAHDFNNILAIMRLQADFLKNKGGLSGDKLEAADDIITSVESAAALTRQLLMFSSREIFQPRDLDLTESITGMVRMLSRLVGEHIEIRLRMAPEPMYLHADSGMMDQIVLNLVVNARDAMPEGGRIVIETSGVEFDEFATSQSPEMRVGSFVCLSVSDSGIGIPPEILPKIFEPFFTTKDVGKGTGLGLATVFGIVRQHQGWANVYSEVGQGTTFRIYLPRLTGDAGAHRPHPVQQIMPAGSETILIVEDNPKLRLSVTSALSQLGYRILEAPSGVKAMDIWREQRGAIRLLLTDLVMPDGMTGRELARRVLQENPELKVIYMSGYSADITGTDFPLQEGVNFLTKPFSAHQLAQTVRNRLDA